MANLNVGKVGNVAELPFADRAEILKPQVRFRKAKLSIIKPCCLRPGATVPSMPKPDVMIYVCQECGARHIRFGCEPGNMEMKVGKR